MFIKSMISDIYEWDHVIPGTAYLIHLDIVCIIK
jgi:hypothetical protein